MHRRKNMSLLLGALGELATALINNNTQTTISNNERKVAQTQTIAKAVVGVAAIAGAAYVGKKVIENIDTLQISTPIGPVMLKGKQVNNQNVLPASSNEPKKLSGGAPTVEVDVVSVWIDRDDGTFGGNLVNVDTGESVEFAYHLEDIGNNKHQVYESVNDGDWQQIGKIDLNNANIDDSSKEISDGPIFSEMLKIARKL